MNEETELDSGLGLNGHNVKEMLIEMRDEMDIRSSKHKKHELLFNVLNGFIMYPSFLLSMIITSITGAQSYGPNPTNVNTTIFALSLVSSILAGTNAFFHLSKNASKYHITGIYYQNIAIELRSWLIWTRSREQLKAKLLELKTKETLITDYENPLYF